METLIVFPNLPGNVVCYVITMEGTDECVREFRAFVRGGLCGIKTLRKVYPNIMKEYNVSRDKLELVLSAAGLELHRGKIKPLTCEASRPKSPATGAPTR